MLNIAMFYSKENMTTIEQQVCSDNFGCKYVAHTTKKVNTFSPLE